MNRVSDFARSRTTALVVLVILVGAVFVFQHNGTTTLRDSQRAGCERSKVDRTAIANALRAQANYLNGVLDAASVKEDVKKVARSTQKTFNISAMSLESRTGTRLDCNDIYPKAGLFG
jgi:hypothetical protein